MSSPTANTAPTLFSRLACACNCAYGISSKTGSYIAPAIYDPAVNWTAPPTAISATKSGGGSGPKINACLVGINQDGIIIAFRGTLPPAWTVASLEDWWQDIVDSAPVSAPPLPGKVHSGFWAALNTLWEDVVTAVELLQQKYPSAPIYVTGHSKGGPLASLGAARLMLGENIIATQVVTFASPHPGDTNFVTHYPMALPVTRLENYLDLVPFLPPTQEFVDLFKGIGDTKLGKAFCHYFPKICAALHSTQNWDYSSLGKLDFVTSSGDVVGIDNYQAIPEYRFVQILAALFGLGDHYQTLAELAADPALSEDATPELAEAQLLGLDLSKIGAAHCIACQSASCAGGYMTGAGGDPICPACSV
ncbi:MULTISPECIES: lipase family protein [Corallincola]|uniref:Lipase family protein n=2 Tax=Corallincola TaxID=1775176 RepID=A0ABY1WU70_9GAMM|nr:MULTISPECIES: lipase family protein [Corallincola]TAA48270.1 lipase family protein [Corallincola spongiicola]TCI02421.1 lipase family protein [Corallincola luteus]